MLSPICTARMDLPVLESANRMHSSPSYQKRSNSILGFGFLAASRSHLFTSLIINSGSRPVPSGRGCCNCQAVGLDAGFVLVIGLIPRASLRISSMIAGRSNMMLSCKLKVISCMYLLARTGRLPGTWSVPGMVQISVKSAKNANIISILLAKKCKK